MTTPLHDRTERQLARYGVTPEAWHAELEACNYRCCLCLRPFSTTRLPCVEHCHADGMWRGIACTDCNYKLGLDHDDAEWYERAAAYLKNPPAAHWRMFKPGSIGEHNERRPE
jgi:hypothetical protein